MSLASWPSALQRNKLPVVTTTGFVQLIQAWSQDVDLLLDRYFVTSEESNLIPVGSLSREAYVLRL